METSIRVFCKNNQQYYPVRQGCSIKDIAELYPSDKEWPILAAKVNNVPTGLDMRLFSNKDVEFIDYRDPAARRSYVYSLCFLLYTALRHMYPGGQLRMRHSISNGYFCQVNLGHDLKESDLMAIKKEMERLIKADIVFKRREAHTLEVADLFRSQGDMDKAALLESRSSIYSTYYELDGVIDNYFNFLVPSTGYLRNFGLEIYKDGLLLRIPSSTDFSHLMPNECQDKMFNAFRESLDWQEKTHLSSALEIQRAIRSGYLSEMINVTEAIQEKKIIRIAEHIANETNIRMVLISGPSSSGKTTFSKRLSVQLMACGRTPYPISLDDYFVNREDTPKDENGEYDFEALQALDLGLFNRDLQALLDGEEIALPHFNFTTGKREYLGNKLQLTPDMILILEGNHGLNPDLTAGVHSSSKFMIYVSALTSLNLDDHNWIPTTDNRLLRRIIRDNSFRGWNAQDTIRRWPSVRRGEDKWIFPFQENADVMFNSALVYELSALKSHAEPLLRGVPNNVPEYGEALRLLRFLEHIPIIQDKDIPLTSLLREFLGGSSFRY